MIGLQILHDHTRHQNNGPVLIQMKTNEAFSRVRIDALLRDQGWNIQDPNAVRFEYMLPDGTRADYVLCDRNGRSLAVVEAKKSAINPADAAAAIYSAASECRSTPTEETILDARIYFCRQRIFQIRCNLTSVPTLIE